MPETPSSAPSARTENPKENAVRAPVAAAQSATKDQVEKALGDATKNSPVPAQANNPTGTVAGDELAVIPTPRWMQNSPGPQWPSLRTAAKGAAFVAAVTQPVVTIPALATLWGAHKTHSLAEKYVPPYRWASSGVKKIVALPIAGAKALASSVYGVIGWPINKVLNGVKTLALRPSLGVVNWTLDFARDIFQFVEVKLGIIEKPEGKNKIDAPAVGALGVGKFLKSIVTELWAHKKTTAAVVMLLYGASMLPGGIPVFLTSLSRSFATAVSAGMAGLSQALSTAPVVVGPGTAAPAAGGMLKSVGKWLLGL